jgi:hypothetical protein
MMPPGAEAEKGLIYNRSLTLTLIVAGGERRKNIYVPAHQNTNTNTSKEERAFLCVVRQK